MHCAANGAAGQVAGRIQLPRIDRCLFQQAGRAGQGCDGGEVCIDGLRVTNKQKIPVRQGGIELRFCAGDGVAAEGDGFVGEGLDAVFGDGAGLAFVQVQLDLVVNDFDGHTGVPFDTSRNTATSPYSRGRTRPPG